MPEVRISIGEVARRSGFAASAIRYYETQGLIASERMAGGQRQFERGVLRRLAFIRAAANVGLTIDEIRTELDQLPSGRTPTKADWHRMSQHWRGRLDEQIAALERLRNGLESCIGCGCLSLKHCTIANPGDMAAASGPGAAYLPRAIRR